MGRLASGRTPGAAAGREDARSSAAARRAGGGERRRMGLLAVAALLGRRQRTAHGRRSVQDRPATLPSALGRSSRAQWRSCAAARRRSGARAREGGNALRSTSSLHGHRPLAPSDARRAPRRSALRESRRGGTPAAAALGARAAPLLGVRSLRCIEDRLTASTSRRAPPRNLRRARTPSAPSARRAQRVQQRVAEPASCIAARSSQLKPLTAAAREHPAVVQR